MVDAIVPKPESVSIKGTNALKSYFKNGQTLEAIGPDKLYDLRRYMATAVDLDTKSTSLRSLSTVLRDAANGHSVSPAEMEAFNKAADAARLKVGVPELFNKRTTANAFAANEASFAETKAKIVQAEVKAIRAAGLSTNDAVATSNVRHLLNTLGRIPGGPAALAGTLAYAATGPLHDLFVKDPSQAESLAKMLIENEKTLRVKDLNNNVDAQLSK